MSKKVVWEDESTNATVNVISHSTPSINPAPMRVLFLGGLCSAHSLTASTISNALAALTQKAEVDYHLFQADGYEKDHHGTLKKGEVLAVQDNWLTNKQHQVLGKFLSQIVDAFNKTNYDYVVLEFDGNRIWSSYKSYNPVDDETEAQVAKCLAPYYNAQNPRIVWITDGSNQADVKSSDPFVKEYFRPSTYQPMKLGQENNFTNNYRAALALFDPNAHPGYNPELSGYKPFVTNGITCFGYKDEKVDTKKGTFYAGTRWDAQIAYTNSADVVNKINEIVKILPYNIETFDQIQMGVGLSITGVKAQIIPCTTDELKQKYKDVSAVEAAESDAWTRLYEWNPESGLTYVDTTLGITKRLSVEMTKNKVVVALTNMSYDAWTRLQIEVADNGEFRTTSRGAVYNKITKQWEKDPNDGKAHTVYVDERGGRLDAEGEAKTEVLWGYDTRTVKADVTNGKAWINGEWTNELGVAVGNDVTVRHEGDPGFVLRSVTVDGKPSTEAEVHFKNIQDNHQVTVVYGVANLPIEVDGKTQDPDAPGGLPVPPDPENTGDNETGVKNVLKVYDGIATNLVIDVTDPDDGCETIVYSTNEWETVLSENPTFVDAGTNKVWYAISADGYKSVTNYAWVTIVPRPVTLTAPSAEKTYDGTPLVANAVEVTAGSFAPNEGVAVASCTGSRTDVGESVNVLGYELKGNTKPDNYVITEANGTLKVTPAHVDDPSRPGDPAPDTGLDFGPGWTGDVPYKGEAWEPEVSCTNRFGTLDPERDYDVAYCDNVDSTNRALVVITGKGNYTGVFTNVFAITKVPLTATADDKSLVYGSEVPGAGFYTFTYEGFVHDEDESVVETAPTFSSAYAKTSPVGTLPVEKATDGAARNYEFVYVPGTLTVVESAPCFGAELKWVFCSNTGTYFAQLKVTCLNASDGFSYKVGKMRYCFQDRVEGSTLKLGLWDARKNKALSKVPQVETLDGQSYSYFPLVDPNPGAKNGGWAPSVSKSYGPADDDPVMTAAERLSTPEMRVYRRVNPSYHNEEIVLDGSAPSAFVGWLVWDWKDATGAARTSMIPVTAGEPKAGYSLMLDTAPLDRPLSTGEMDERIAAGVAFDELTDVKLTITSFAIGTSGISGTLRTQNARTGRTGVPGVNAQIVLKAAATPDGSFGKAATATANPDGRFAFERPGKGTFFKLELHALPLLK